MPTALTEDAGNADFGTGLPVPSNGDDSADWFPQLIAAYQQLADRSQALAQLSGAAMSGGGSTRKILVPIVAAVLNSGSIFTYVASSGAHYWQQTSVAGVGGLRFEVPQLPIGATIAGVYAWVANDANTTLPVGTMPALLLTKNVYSVGSAADPGTYDATVGSASDATAVVATYKLMHKNAITGLTEVVAQDVIYRIMLTGETGANAATGLNLAAIFIELAVA